MKKVVIHTEWYLPKYDEHFAEILENGPYQLNNRRWALKFVENYNTAIDIGSNVGFWSKPLCKKFKKVVAFEPDKDNNECFKENLKDLTNWQLEEVALSNKSGTNTLYYDGKNCGDMSMEHSYKEFKQEIKTRKLDNYVNKFEKNTVDFIKIDTQEHEYKILEGGLKFLSNHNAVLCIEIPRRDKREKANAKKLEKLLKTIGYELEGVAKKESIFKRPKKKEEDK